MANERATNGTEQVMVDTTETIRPEDESKDTVDEDRSPPERTEFDPVRESPIYKFAEQLMSEAQSLADKSKEEVIGAANAEAAKIRADAEVEAREKILEPAQLEAESKARITIADGEQKAREILSSARDEAKQIGATAKDRAERMESEAGGRIQRLTDTVTEEIRSALKDITRLLPGSEGAADAPDEELEVEDASATPDDTAGAEDQAAKVR